MADEEKLEEQQDELEAIASIFDDDYKPVSVDAPPFKFSLNLYASGEDAESSHVGVRMDVEFPGDYPEEKPLLVFTAIKGEAILTGEGEGGEENIMPALEAAVDEEAEDSLGGQMIFTLAEAVRSFLEENNIDPKSRSLHAKMAKREDAKVGVR